MKTRKKIVIIFSIISIISLALIIGMVNFWRYNELIISENNSDEKLAKTILQNLKQRDFTKLEAVHCSPYLVEQEQSDFNSYYKKFVEKIKNIDFKGSNILSQDENEIIFNIGDSKLKNQRLIFYIQKERSNYWLLKFKERKCMLVDADFNFE